MCDSDIWRHVGWRFSWELKVLEGLEGNGMEGYGVEVGFLMVWGLLIR